MRSLVLWKRKGFVFIIEQDQPAFFLHAAYILEVMEAVRGGGLHELELQHLYRVLPGPHDLVRHHQHLYKISFL